MVYRVTTGYMISIGGICYSYATQLRFFLEKPSDSPAAIVVLEDYKIAGSTGCDLFNSIVQHCSGGFIHREKGVT
jgi:hypothetical protein